MGDQARLPGELLYEASPKITQVVEYGVSMEALVSGQAPPPAEGARYRSEASSEARALFGLRPEA